MDKHTCSMFAKNVVMYQATNSYGRKSKPHNSGMLPQSYNRAALTFQYLRTNTFLFYQGNQLHLLPLIYTKIAS